MMEGGLLVVDSPIVSPLFSSIHSVIVFFLQSKIGSLAVRVWLGL